MQNDVARELRQIKWILVGVLVMLAIMAVAVAGPLIVGLFWIGLVVFVCGVTLYIIVISIKTGWLGMRNLWWSASDRWHR